VLLSYKLHWATAKSHGGGTIYTHLKVLGIARRPEHGPSEFDDVPAFIDVLIAQ